MAIPWGRGWWSYRLGLIRPIQLVDVWVQSCFEISIDCGIGGTVVPDGRSVLIEVGCFCFSFRVLLYCSRSAHLSTQRLLASWVIVCQKSASDYHVGFQTVLIPLLLSASSTSAILRSLNCWTSAEWRSFVPRGDLPRDHSTWLLMTNASMLDVSAFSTLLFFCLPS